MNEKESKFNPEYEYLNDSEIRSLQFLLDEYVSGRDLKQRETSKESFPGEMRRVLESCLKVPERAKLLMQFLQTNIRFNYAGGIGKDMSNPVVKAITKATKELAAAHPELLR